MKELLFNHVNDIEIIFPKCSYVLVEGFSNLNVHQQD